MIVLGIESSCDETAAALVEDGRHILSSVIASQIAIHEPFGGVVPELASRCHIEAIQPVIQSALEKAQMGFDDIDAIAVTRGPGLVGALLVGFCYAKAMAYTLKKPWVGINHLEGHIHALFLCEDFPSFPFVVLLASGGHTSLYHVTSPTGMELLGRTRDDAAGEAFDKVAKMLNLGYPGGAIIEKLAQKGRNNTIDFPRGLLNKGLDFSFSGLKSAVLRHLQTHPNQAEQAKEDLVASFQEAVVDVLCQKLLRAAKRKKCHQIALVGGVAANGYLRNRLYCEAYKKSLQVFIPPAGLCGDNAAMIAASGFHYINNGITSAWDTDVFASGQ